jgi:hypothetical protein
MPWSSQLASNEMKVALALPPSSLPMKSQFFHGRADVKPFDHPVVDGDDRVLEEAPQGL